MWDHKMHLYENTHVLLKEEIANILGLAFSYINVVRDGEYGKQLAAQ
jgi:hypothetical protein